MIKINQSGKKERQEKQTNKKLERRIGRKKINMTKLKAIQ